jgi:hypothetical protein
MRFSGGYQTVKRFVRKLHGNQQPRQRAVIFTAPGESWVRLDVPLSAAARQIGIDRFCEV